MNHKKWGRFLGVGKSFAGDLPIVQTVIDFSHLARAPLSGARAGPVSSQAGWFEIDPPAGGFADGDIIGQIPSQDWAHKTLNAVVAPDLSNHFLPGIYECRFQMTPPLNAAAFRGFYVKFQNADPDAERALEPSMDSPEIGVVTVASLPVTATPRDYAFQLNAYLPGRWYLTVRSRNVLADANTCYLGYQISALHLLDDGASAR